MMTIERLSENPVLPFDRDACVKGGMPLAKYVHELVTTIQKDYLYKIIYYINHLPQTMTWSEADSCDATHPVTTGFKIPANMTEITSVKVSFEILAFRSYSKAVASGGGATSSSGGGTTVSSAAGGGQTTSSGGGATTSDGGGTTVSSASGGGQTTSDGGSTTTEAGGQQTSSSNGAGNYATGLTRAGGLFHDTSTEDGSVGNHEHSWQEDSPGHSHDLSINDHTHTVADHTHGVGNHTHTVSDHQHSVTVGNHNHTVADHTHTVADHTHSVTLGDHTHTTPNHTHDLTPGIYEETNAPTVYFKVDNGSGFGLASDNYTEDQTDIDITNQITSVGRKKIAFYASDLCRIRADIEVQVKVRAE